jgi:hypothetical protein
MVRNTIFVAKIFFNTIKLTLQGNVLDGLRETLTTPPGNNPGCDHASPFIHL